MNPNYSAPATAKQHTVWLLLPMVFVLLAGTYFTARFGGRWAEADSTTFADVIRATVSSGHLASDASELYPNGYAFQAISVFVLATTGLSVAALQQLIYPLLACLVVLPAWALYRELSGSARAATLTTILLFTQPEFLFVVLRSSHEKFTRTFMLLCLFLLVRSFRMGHRPWVFATHVVLFYLSAFAFIASNNLLAHSFIVALASALALGWLLERRVTSPHQPGGATIQRLLLATFVCLGLVYLFVFYIYTPAQHDLFVMKDTVERVKALFFDTQTDTGADTTFNSYAYISFGWVSLPVYFMVSIANWIVLAASFVIWLRQGVRWLVRGQAPATRAGWLLWLLYAAFALQGALSVLADYSGAIAGNLQHRLYPSFSLVAVAVVGAALARWQPRRFGRLIGAGLAVLIAAIAVLSAFKASNEPLLSNKWTFYRTDEIKALEWADSYLAEEDIGVEYDERLSVAAQMAGALPNNNNYLSTFNPEDLRVFLLTSISRLRSSRLGAPLPVPPDALQIYDNGEAELYRVRPQTPYQR